MSIKLLISCNQVNLSDAISHHVQFRTESTGVPIKMFSAPFDNLPIFENRRVHIGGFFSTHVEFTVKFEEWLKMKLELFLRDPPNVSLGLDYFVHIRPQSNICPHDALQCVPKRTYDYFMSVWRIHCCDYHNAVESNAIKMVDVAHGLNCWVELFLKIRGV